MRRANPNEHSRPQPHEQVTSQRGFPVLVNGSWAAASAATSHKPTARPVALPRPLRVSLLPCLADGFLLGRGDRAALERTDQEDSAQNGWQDLPQRSSSQWAQSSVALFDHLIRPLKQRLRDRQAEGPGGLEVDHQLELGRLLDR
jgi:hypothetical protein